MIAVHAHFGAAGAVAEPLVNGDDIRKPGAQGLLQPAAVVIQDGEAGQREVVRVGPADVQKAAEPRSPEGALPARVRPIAQPAGHLQLPLLPQGLDGVGEAPEVDEAGGVVLVIVALLKGDQLFGVQALVTEEVMMLPL